MSDKKTMSSSIEIAAPPSVIFDILANPHRHPEIDGSGTLKPTVEGPDRLSLDAKFKMQLKNGPMSYSTPNKVIEFEEKRLIAWKHFGPQIWRYELEPVGNSSTKVTESFDYSRYGPFGFIIKRMFAGNQQSIEKTLVRLKERSEKTA